MSSFSPKTQCRLCASVSLETVLDMGHSPIGEDFILPEQKDRPQPLYPVVLMRCADCGHLQLSGVVEKRDIYTDYLYETTRSLGLDKHFDAYAQSILTLPGVQPGQWVVDMGSNTGALLYSLQKRGMRVQGVEPARRVAKKAMEQGVPTTCAYFDSAFAQEFCAAHGAAAVITANNVFANIDDLDSVMTAVDTLLAPDGYFIVETGYALDLIQNFVIDNIYHEHISYFFLAPLIRYFERHNLRITRAERTPTKGGSLRVYARRASLNEKPEWSVEGLHSLERELMFNTSLPFDLFAEQAQTKRARALHAIEQRRRYGALGAFGAAVGCTAMIYWLGIAEHIEYIIDDNALMHGRLSPHAHIPVLSPEEACRRNTPTIINLPWRYASAIMRRHASYMQNGGCFLQILPSVFQYDKTHPHQLNHQ